jgi:hypothetical protein
MQSDAGASPSKSTVHTWRHTKDISAMIEFQFEHFTQNLMGVEIFL